jgi:hypothetical protein
VQVKPHRLNLGTTPIPNAVESQAQAEVVSNKKDGLLINHPFISN